MKHLRTLVFCGALLAPATSWAGGWTQEEGAAYAKVWGTGVFGSGAFDLDGEVVETDSFSLLSLSGYGEYGLRPDLTLVASVQPVGVASFGDQRRGYVGGTLVGLRQRLVSGPLQFAIEARVGGSPGFGGERDMAPEDAAVEFRPTVRTYVAEWDLQLGVPISTIGWFSVALGPRWTTNPDLQPVLQGSAQLGFGPFAGFVFDAHTALNYTFAPPAVINAAGASDTRYVGLGLGASWWLTEGFAVNVAMDIGPYAVSNAAAATLRLGVEFRR